MLRSYARAIALIGALATLPACLFANVTVPLSYRSPTPSDVGGTAHLGQVAHGRACNHGILGLVAWGDGGYAAAMARAQGETGNGALLADVQADTSALNVLFLYQRRCTIVHARVVQ